MSEAAARDAHLHAGELHAGEVILESLASGVITAAEIEGLTAHQTGFSHQEEAAALKPGRLLDQRRLQLDCRVQS